MPDGKKHTHRIVQTRPDGIPVGFTAEYAQLVLLETFELLVIASFNRWKSRHSAAKVKAQKKPPLLDSEKNVNSPKFDIRKAKKTLVPIYA